VAWSTGAGWGFLLTFAAYAKKKEDIALNAFTTVWGNMSASFLAATAIAVTVFTFLPVDKANEALGSGNSGLAFIYLTKLMANMPMSYLVSVFFFLAFFFAAFTSLIPMYEIALTNFVDAGYSRNKIALILFVFAIFAGIPSALNIGFQDSQDFVWGLGLWISGMFITYAIIQFGVEKAREYINEVSDIKIGVWYDYSIKYAIPIMFVVLFGWWIWQSFQWYDFDFVKILSFNGTGYNLGTILVWWIFALMTAMLGSTAITSRKR
jgi:NSS family neurotransmitter:Na+ symporter